MHPCVKVIQPSGLLTGDNAKQLRYKIDDFVSTGVNIVLVDLQDVKFIDSSGLGTLIAAQRIAKTANCQLFLCSVNQQVKMLFDLNKMERFFEIFTDREEFNKLVISTSLAVEELK